MPTKKKSPSLAKSGWKDVQSKSRRSRRTKLALGVFGLVIGLLILSWTIRFTQSLFNPWKASTGISRSYTWNGEFNINLLVRTDHISVLTFSPKEKKIIIINIPDETFLEVPSGFGSWQLRAVYALGQSQNNNEYKLLIDTVRSFLAIPIDGFLDFSELKPAKSTVEVVDVLRQNPLSGFNLLSSLKTNLTAWELIRLKLGMSGVRFDKVEELNLDKLDILDKESLPDGTPIFTADPVKLDSVLSDLADPAIVAEHKTIAVLNATTKPQLALKWARLISNLGGNVIITSNAGAEAPKNQLQGVQSATLKRLRQIFGFTEKEKLSNEPETASRAQINLILGEDYVNK